MVYVKNQRDEIIPVEFKTTREAISYCKTATRMFSELILSIFQDNAAISHYKQGIKIR